MGRSNVKQHLHVEALKARDDQYNRTGQWWSRAEWEQWLSRGSGSSSWGR